MKIFYLCRTGHHTSLLAAALYAGVIDENETRPWSRLSGFDSINITDVGTPYYVGLDEENREVYTIGVWNENLIMSKAANELISLMGVPRGRWKIVDTTSITSRWTCLGQIMKTWHFDFWAKLFCQVGARKEMKILSSDINRPDYNYVLH